MFYDQVYKLCKQNRISITSFVENSLKMSRSNVTKWREGVTPKSDTVQKIADYFGVTTDYLLGNTDIKNKPATDKGNELSDDDAQLLKLFNQVPEESKALVVGMIEAALKSHGLLK